MTFWLAQKFFSFTYFVLWHFTWHKHFTNSWPNLMYCCFAIADMMCFNLKLIGFQMLPFPVNQGLMTSKTLWSQESLYLEVKCICPEWRKKSSKKELGEGRKKSIIQGNCGWKEGKNLDRFLENPNTLQKTAASNIEYLGINPVRSRWGTYDNKYKTWYRRDVNNWEIHYFSKREDCIV